MDSLTRRALIHASLAATSAGLLAACTPGSPTAQSPAPSSPVPASPSAASRATAPDAAATQASETTTAAPTSASDLPAAAPAASARRKFSLTDPTSQWVVVNKQRPLKPLTFAPADLVRPNVQPVASGELGMINSTTASAAEAMFGAAAAEGVTMVLASGYRSYASQQSLYGGYVSSRGQADADTASARPGYSEHQSGWSFDITDGSGAASFTPDFQYQPAAIWAKANAHRFGFIVRYPWMLHPITGYYYEPWHLRFIGVEAASYMASHKIETFEQYLGLPAAPGYL
ncbi:M15 family metallopeptidase [Pseudarthrobacter sp. J1763]|uniref:M15 family metallopeptidase n=1 Tax=Pseudarthrobacter sp. J1763 TaxID=3420445 RepID=UPI003D2A6BC1